MKDTITYMYKYNGHWRGASGKTHKEHLENLIKIMLEFREEEGNVTINSFKSLDDFIKLLDETKLKDQGRVLNEFIACCVDSVKIHRTRQKISRVKLSNFVA